MIARLVALPIVIVMVIPITSGLGVADASGRATSAREPLIDATVSAELAQAGPNQDLTVIVHMRDRASLASASRGTRRQRLRAVEQALRSTSDTSQVGLRTLLRNRQVQGRVRSFEPLWVTNSVIVTATADVIQELARRADVASITADTIDVVPTGTPAAPPEPNVSIVNAPTLWNLGYDGQGVVVAGLDSGVDVSHPDLAANYRGGSNSWFDPYGEHPTTPTDLTGHGTATMGVAVGGGNGGTTVGVAPGARWIAGRIFNDAGTSTAGAIHLALQWILDPDGNPDTADAPLVVNNSWAFATPGCNLEFQPDLQAMRAAGIVPVFAAGNYGPGAGTSVSPANYPEALSVGATTNLDRNYAYSSRGPSACGEASGTYPDVVAPGVNIWTTDRNGLYSYWTGTSLAAPAVTGAIALLASTGQTAAMSPEVALLDTPVDLGVVGPDDTFGRGRIDIAAAYQALVTPPTSTTTTLPQTTTTTLPQTTTTTLPPTTTSTTTTTLPPTTTSTLPQTTTTTSPPTTTSTTTTTLPGGGTAFADGFESGSTGAWSSAVTNAGRLSVTSAAKLTGSFGLQARIVNTGQMYVGDTSPNAAVSFVAGFQFDPNSVVASGTKTHDVFRAMTATATSAIVVQLRGATGGYQVRAGTRLANGTMKYTAWLAFSDAPHAIKLTWLAASTSTGSNGSMSMSVDGFTAGSLATLANGPVRIEEVRLGAQGIAAGISGTEYYDAYTSTV